MVSHDVRYFEWLTFQPYLLLDSFCEIQLLKGCISMTTIISAVHGTVFHYSLLFSSILWKFLTLLISRLISNISFIQLSSLLSGYPASIFFAAGSRSWTVVLGDCCTGQSPGNEVTVLLVSLQARGGGWPNPSHAL